MTGFFVCAPADEHNYVKPFLRHRGLCITEAVFTGIKWEIIISSSALGGSQSHSELF